MPELTDEVFQKIAASPQAAEQAARMRAVEPDEQPAVGIRQDWEHTTREVDWTEILSALPTERVTTLRRTLQRQADAHGIPYEQVVAEFKTTRLYQTVSTTPGGGWIRSL